MPGSKLFEGKLELAQGWILRAQYSGRMSRPHRIHFPEVPLHIVQRGHSGAPCFLDTEDFETYLHWLGLALEKYECELHAYALMTNHVHLLLTPSDPEGVAKLFMSQGRRYVQHFNTKYEKSGSLWEARYYASAVKTDVQLMRCYRYVDLNPVRACIVQDPAQYRFCSYAANALA